MNNKQQLSDHALRRSLRLIQFEAVLTSVLLVMPVINIFYAQEVGLSLKQIGLSQAAFTLGVLLLDVPTGWIADRFSRKWCNVVGDTICALTILFYATANSFSDVVVAELLFAVGIAFSGGADVALIRGYAKGLGLNYRKIMARIATWQSVAAIVGMVAGGLIGAVDLRLAMAASAVVYFAGAALSLGMVDVGEKRSVEHRNPIRDIAYALQHALRGNTELQIRMVAFALSREVTHPSIWLLTPILLAAHVPVAVVGAGWAIYSVLVGAGSALAHRFATHMEYRRIYAVGMSVALLASTILAVQISAATVLFYGLFGLVRGWFAATNVPAIQEITPDTVQATTVSLANTGARVLYMPLVFAVGAGAEAHLQRGFLLIALVFGPLSILTYLRLRPKLTA